MNYEVKVKTEHMSGDLHVAAPIFDPQYTNVHRIARLVKNV